MATVAANLATRGPLSSALGQWVFIGFGTFVIFTGDNGVSKAAHEVASLALRLITGRDGLAAALLGESALSSKNSFANGGGAPQQQPPIVIHTVSPSSDNSNSNNSITSRYFGWGTLIQITIGTGTIWGSYILFSQYLPEHIKELLPVTRKFFDTAVTHLGQGILRVRDVLSEQITLLGLKQDELSEKQDVTNSHVLNLKEDMNHVKVNVEDIALAISRCEDSLEDAAGRQTYMSRGVRLLVKCVGDIMRPSNPAVAAELERFSRLGAGLDGEDEGEEAPATPKNQGHGGHHQHHYPSSPILSEISGSATEVGDMHHFSLPGSAHHHNQPHHHHHHHPTVSPSPFAHSPSLPLTGSSTNHHHRTSMLMRSASAMASSSSTPLAPPSGAPSAPTTPGAPATSNNANPSSISPMMASRMTSTYLTPRQGSSPEDEVPMPSNFNNKYSSSRQNLSLDDVDQLLSSIRNDRVSVQA